MNAPTIAVAHDTILLERDLPHPAAAVFRAYADIDKRVQWSAPSDDEIVIFESHDFRVGGVDRFLCGHRDDPNFAGTTRYEHIDDRHIVFTERLVDGHDALLAVSLVTWAITPTGSGCRLVVTDQVVSVAGQGPIDGSRDGYAAILDQLARHLATQTAT
jgi:uncharacterized protein YndB with AHSA1/START domain